MTISTKKNTKIRLTTYQSIETLQDQEKILSFLYENDKPFFELFHTKYQFPFFITALLWGIPTSLIQILFAFLYNENSFSDFSFLVGIMISIIMFLMLWATKRLRIFLIKIHSITSLNADEYIHNYCKKFTTFYGGYRLAFWGLFFGFANMIFGLVFGIWYKFEILIILLCIQYFYVGFVAGMAIGGVYTIISIVLFLSHEKKLKFNFLDSDKCGGTLEIGKILFTFSISLFLGAITIASYIYITPWTNFDEGIFYRILIYFWIAFPFIISLSVIIFPVIKLRSKLKSYKEHEASKIRNKLSIIHIKLIELDTDYKEKAENQIAFLKDHFYQLIKFEELLNKMNIIPYDLKLRLAYYLTVASSSLYLGEYLRRLF